MLISARTMINTTIFWIVVGIGFRGYTKWIDSVPAQQILQAIGRDEFSELSLPESTIATCNTDSIYERLLILEGIMHATNMNCSNNTMTMNSLGKVSESNNTTSPINPSQTTLQIPVFNQTLDRLLPASVQPSPTSFAMITRPIDDIDNIDMIIKTLQSTILTPAEQQRGYINIFANNPFTIQASDLQGDKLKIKLGNIESLSSVELVLLEQGLKNTFLQFPQISEVAIIY